MRKIKYKIGKSEMVGCVPAWAVIDAYILYEGGSGDAIIFTPSKIKWKHSNGSSGIDDGCGSISFAKLHRSNKYWIKSEFDYMNLPTKTSKKLKRQSSSKKKSTTSKIDIVSNVTLDEIRNGLIENLSTDELVSFFISFYERMTDDQNFVRKLCNESTALGIRSIKDMK